MSLKGLSGIGIDVILGNRTKPSQMINPRLVIDLLGIKTFLGGIKGYNYIISSWYLTGYPDGITLGQQYNTREKPHVILYTYINRHAATPESQ